MRLCIPLLAGAVALATGSMAWANDAVPSVASDATSEVIEVWDERKHKPFDRDTELRLTGEDLKERGASTLAEALELLPDVYVRESGRGGRQIDVRGARKGQVKVIIDGVAVADPYAGNFDLTSIPVTDIVQIRVSTSPASPIDGPGGPGAVIEVHTRDAIGTRLVVGRLQARSLPGFDGSVTGRAHLNKHFAIRLSASGEFSGQDIQLATPYMGNIDEDRTGASGAIRLEYRNGARRAVVDLFGYSRGFVVPPAENDLIAVIEPETGGRVGLTVDDRIGTLRVRANAYFHRLDKTTLRYSDKVLQTLVPAASDAVVANRAGGFVLANRPFGKHLHAIVSAAVATADALAETRSGGRIEGRASIASAATGLQYERGPLRVDGAAGIAVPFGIGASPWPEAKLVVKYKAAKPLTLQLTGARKGRTPTLRERFDSNIGNPDLGPEQARYAELGVVIRPRDGIRIAAASFVRDTNGLIRFDLGRGSLINLGDLVIRGFDLRARFTVTKQLRVGGSWVFQDAFSEVLGSDPLDFLPQHRGDAWIKARVSDRLGGLLRLRYVGEQIDRAAVLDARIVVDASAYYRVARQVFASIRVDNGVDDNYQVRTGVANPGRVFTLSVQGTFE